MSTNNVAEIQYTILVSCGRPVEFKRATGWDSLFATRAEAEACAERARRNDGWSAKVISLSAQEAAEWNETVSERLARERRELMGRLPARPEKVV